MLNEATERLNKAIELEDMTAIKVTKEMLVAGKKKMYTAQLHQEELWQVRVKIGEKRKKMMTKLVNVAKVSKEQWQCSIWFNPA